jgi:antitoxin component HigA of HigAB toxin-antitoxin module
MGLFEKIKSISSATNVDEETIPETGLFNIEGFDPAGLNISLGLGIGVNALEEQAGISPEVSELINGVQNGTVDINSLTQKLAEQAGISPEVSELINGVQNGTVDINSLTQKLAEQAGISPEVSELINGVQNGTVDINSLTQKLAEQAGISLSGEAHSGYEAKEGWGANYNKNHSGSGEVIPGVVASGEVTQEANVFAGAYSKGDAYIKWNSEQVGISTSTQSMIGVEVNEKTSVKGSLDIEGIDHNVGVDASSQTRGFAGAKVGAETDIVLSEDNVYAGLGAKAFAGVEIQRKLGGSLSVDGDSFTRAEIHAAAKAGIGAELNVDVGYRNGQIDFEIDMDAAFGIGYGVGFKASVDAPGILTHPEAVIESITPGIISHPQVVTESVVITVEDLGDSIADVFGW